MLTSGLRTLCQGERSGSVGVSGRRERLESPGVPTTTIR